jgi:uncharacterized protein YegL
MKAETYHSDIFINPLHTLKIFPRNVAKEYAFCMKQVIFVIDVSCSMSNVLPYVQDSLKIFDELLGENNIDIHLITFSNFATYVANSRHGFIEAIDTLRADLFTNMGDGLRIAFDIVNNEKASWIIVLTDGESNKGTYQTVEEFKELINDRKQNNAKLVTIGFGKNTDPDVLNSIGEYVCIFERKDIMKVIGALYNEITTSSIINLTIEPSGSYTTEIGNTNVGVLFNDRVYIYACTGNVTSFIVKYTAIQENSLENAQVELKIEENDLNLPGEITREYFFSKASRLIEEFYKSKDKNKEIQRIKNIFSNENWSNKDAETRVNEAMNMFIEDEEFSARFALYSVNSLRDQISHVDDSHLISSTRKIQKKFKKMDKTN